MLWLLLSYLVGCGRIIDTNAGNRESQQNNFVVASDLESSLAEVATPQIIKQLKRELKQQTPQLKIITPQAEQTFNQTDIEIKLDVKDLDVFRDNQFGLGNHLNLIVDNESLQEIYSLEEPVVLKNLAPGTHTIRVLAVFPWGESYKNLGAYAQSTFNILTPTDDNRPQPQAPLLTYNSPTETIGGEPWLLDYYLTNLPEAQAVAEQQEPENTKNAYSVRATINGMGFSLQDWQPRYLTGLELGENWIQLELVDRSGNKINNGFNDTIKIINYKPEQKSNLAKLLRNQIKLQDAKSIIQPNYYIQPVGTPEIVDLDDGSSELEVIEDKLEIIETQSTDTIIDSQESETTLEQMQLKPLELQTRDNLELDSSDTFSEANNESIPENTVERSLQPDSELATSQVASETAVEKIDVEVLHSQEEAVAYVDVAQIDLPGVNNIDEIELEQNKTISQEPLIKPPKPLWWKKFLVNLRQAVEAIAKRLPSEV